MSNLTKWTFLFAIALLFAACSGASQHLAQAEGVLGGLDVLSQALAANGTLDPVQAFKVQQSLEALHTTVAAAQQMAALAQQTAEAAKDGSVLAQQTAEAAKDGSVTPTQVATGAAGILATGAGAYWKLKSAKPA